MLWEGKEQALHALNEAKRVRDALSAADGLDASKMVPLVLRSLGQMIELAECLLGEQEKYESRLHRTHASPAGGTFQQSASQ